jgi:hypothetical protein
MKKIAVIAILICNGLSLISNDTITFKNKLDLSISSISLSDGSIRLGGYGFSRLKYNRNINDFISVGGYGGFGWYNEFKFEKGDNFYHYTATAWKYAAQYGLNSKLHLLPLLLKKNYLRFDCYLSGDIGLMSMFTTPSDNIFPKRGTYFDYSFMGGVSVFLSKRIGVFTEVGYRDFKFHQGSNVEFGLSYRF